MTFKQNWEKINIRHHVPDEVIAEMISILFPQNKIIEHEIISGGCANINVKIHFADIDTPKILRIYLRDPKTAYKEKAIFHLLETKVIVPEIYSIHQLSGYTFAAAKFIPGITLRELLLNPQKHKIAKNFELIIENIMYKAGNIISDLSNIKFAKCGFFDENLNVATNTDDFDLIVFTEKLLQTSNIKKILTTKQRNNIHTLLATNKLFIENESNLVHADFDPANILVQNTNGNIEITGVLDWEFSFSGSSLFDIANMLRYAHHMPEVYSKAFLAGVNEKYVLPQNWESEIHILNLISLLESASRNNIQQEPNKIADIQELVSNILVQLQ